MANSAANFEPYRRRLLGLAYHMLGSMADAEDAVQETYLRCMRPTATGRRTESVSHDHDDADLSRHADVGAGTPRGARPWLPEPVVDTAALSSDSRTELAEDLSIALLLTMRSMRSSCPHSWRQPSRAISIQ